SRCTVAPYNASISRPRAATFDSVSLKRTMYWFGMGTPVVACENDGRIGTGAAGVGGVLVTSLQAATQSRTAERANFRMSEFLQMRWTPGLGGRGGFRTRAAPNRLDSSVFFSAPQSRRSQ